MSGVFVLLSLLYRDLVGITVAVVFIVVCELGVRASVRRSLKGPMPATITISNDEFRVDVGDFWAVRSWTGVSGVRRVREFWVLRYSRAEASTFPTGALTTFQTTAFTDLMRAKGLLRV